MSEEKRRKSFKTKKTFAALTLIALLIIGGSTFALIQFGMPRQNEIQNSPDVFQQESQKVLEAADYFKNIPLQCYVEYTDPQKSRNSASVTLYNETLDELGTQHNMTRNQTLSYVFSQPYFEMYLLQNCKFFNNTLSSTPREFNSSLGSDQPQNIKSMIVNYMNQVMKQDVDFGNFARQNNIESISSFYNMDYSAVVDLMVKEHIFDPSKSCSQVQKAPEGVVMCEWNTSTFIYKINETGSAQPVPSGTPQS